MTITNKVLLAFFSLLLLLGAFYAGIAYNKKLMPSVQNSATSPEPILAESNSEEDKVFESKQLGIQFNYPSNFGISDQDISGVTFYDKLAAGRKEENHFYCTRISEQKIIDEGASCEPEFSIGKFSFRKYTDPNIKSLGQIKDQRVEELLGDFMRHNPEVDLRSFIGSIYLGGLPAYQISTPSLGAHGIVISLIPETNEILELEFQTGYSDMVISSFRLIK